MKNTSNIHYNAMAEAMRGIRKARWGRVRRIGWGVVFVLACISYFWVFFGVLRGIPWMEWLGL